MFQNRAEVQSGRRHGGCASLTQTQTMALNEARAMTRAILAGHGEIGIASIAAVVFKRPGTTAAGGRVQRRERPARIRENQAASCERRAAGSRSLERRAA